MNKKKYIYYKMSEDSMLKCLIAFILGWIVSKMMGNGFSVGVSYNDLPDSCKTGRTEEEAYKAQREAAKSIVGSENIIKNCEDNDQVPKAHLEVLTKTKIGHVPVPDILGCDKYVQCSDTIHMGGLWTDSGCRKCKNLRTTWRMPDSTNLCSAGDEQIECPKIEWSPKCIKLFDVNNNYNTEYLKCLEENYGKGIEGSKCGSNLAVSNCYERPKINQAPGCTIDTITGKYVYRDNYGKIYTFLPREQTCTRVLPKYTCKDWKEHFSCSTDLAPGYINKPNSSNTECTDKADCIFKCCVAPPLPEDNPCQKFLDSKDVMKDCWRVDNKDFSTANCIDCVTNKIRQAFDDPDIDISSVISSCGDNQISNYCAKPSK